MTTANSEFFDSFFQEILSVIEDYRSGGFVEGGSLTTLTNFEESIQSLKTRAQDGPVSMHSPYALRIWGLANGLEGSIVLSGLYSLMEANREGFWANRMISLTRSLTLVPLIADPKDLTDAEDTLSQIIQSIRTEIDKGDLEGPGVEVLEKVIIPALQRLQKLISSVPDSPAEADKIAIEAKTNARINDALLSIAKGAGRNADRAWLVLVSSFAQGPMAWENFVRLIGGLGT